MRVLFDVDVVLDLLLDRVPFSKDAAVLLSMAEGGQLTGHICATAVTALYYIAQKAIGERRAHAQNCANCSPSWNLLLSTGLYWRAP